MSTSEAKGVELPATAGPEDLRTDHIELLLREAERALMFVDARIDEPGRRVLTGVAPEYAGSDAQIASLTLAIAELSDAEPHLQLEIDLVSERLRRLGASAAAGELAKQRGLVDLVRLSLESLVRACPDEDAYDAWVSDEEEYDGWTSAEVYGAYRQLLQVLRNTTVS